MNRAIGSEKEVNIYSFNRLIFIIILMYLLFNLKFTNQKKLLNLQKTFKG